MRTVILFLSLIASLPAQVMHYLPLNPGATMVTGKWIVANSGSNFLITKPDGTTSTVAKAAATTQSVTILALPTNSLILGCTTKTGTAFTGTTTLTATVGITGNLTGCIAAPYNLQSVVSATNSAVSLTPLASFTGTDNLILALTSTIDNLSAISAGSLTLWLTWTVLP